MARTTVTRELLSGSTNGRGIKIAATGSAGTLLHTAHASAKDCIYLWATNHHTAGVKITLEWGGTTDINDTIDESIGFEHGLITLVPGLVLTGSVVLRAYADVSNVVTIFGYVDRMIEE